ncbi:MAG: class II glutamine amidotransferase [Agromyces sp.]
MCRLLATAAAEPRTVADVLGPERPRVFQDMARVHDDGWGHAWLTPGKAVRVQRSAESGFDHSGLAGALTANASPAHLVHLRFATTGLACTIENTHPFIADGMAFAHNGSIAPLAELDDRLPMFIRPSLRGDTDSERYFALIRAHRRAGAGLDTAVMSAVRTIRAFAPAASLNALLLTPTTLVAIHASQHASVPIAALEASANGFRLPEAHDERYYRMHIFRHLDGSVAIASSGMDVTGWDELPTESVSFISLQSLEIQTLSIDTVSSPRATAPMV